MFCCTSELSLPFDEVVEFFWVSITGDNVLDIVVIYIPALISGFLLQPFVSVIIVWVTSQVSIAEGSIHLLGYSLHLPGDPGLAVSWGRHL